MSSLADQLSQSQTVSGKISLLITSHVCCKAICLCLGRTTGPNGNLRSKGSGQVVHVAEDCSPLQDPEQDAVNASVHKIPNMPSKHGRAPCAHSQIAFTDPCPNSSHRSQRSPSNTIWPNLPSCKVQQEDRCKVKHVLCL